jgi:glycosyltransferase involved in cell wall biosynthesis
MIQTHYGPRGSVSVSLIVSIYNKIDFLKLVWASIESQSFRNFEIVVADDGSKPEVVSQLKDFFINSGLPVQHLWHEDLGWRKNRILNHAIVASRGEYIVIIDGDCVLHPDFILDHWNHRQASSCLAGRRLDLSPSVTGALTPEKIRTGYLQKNLWWILPSIAWRKDNNGGKGVRIENESLRRLFNRKQRGIVGCNFSLFKADLLKVNGFDMRYEGPGIGEDSDLEFRLNLAGVRTLPFCHLGVQYHLFHQLLTRKNENEELFKKVIVEKNPITLFGLNQLS